LTALQINSHNLPVFFINTKQIFSYTSLTSKSSGIFQQNKLFQNTVRYHLAGIKEKSNGQVTTPLKDNTFFLTDSVKVTASR